MSEHESPESILQDTQAPKEASSEREANAYLKAGWTLIKTFYSVDQYGGSQKMRYVLAWRIKNAKPKKPHIIKKVG
jgi:hypothetical protein